MGKSGVSPSRRAALSPSRRWPAGDRLSSWVDGNRSDPRTTAVSSRRAPRGRAPRVVVSGGSLHSRAIRPRGTTMTLVLIHGGGATARFWDRLLPHLDRPTIAIDLPGRAGKPADLGTLSIGDEVASVVEDIEASSIGGPISLIAHSD